MPGIFYLPCNLVGGNQGWNPDAQVPHGDPVGNKITGIGLTILTDEGSLRILRIRPPVITLRIKIMKSAGTSLTLGSGNRNRLFKKILIGRRILASSNFRHQ